MSRNSEMFKFTQLRPVNGIDYYEVQRKHFPLYDESEPTSLLEKIHLSAIPCISMSKTALDQVAVQSMARLSSRATRVSAPQAAS